MRFPALVGIAVATLVASFASANAQQSVQAGILECQGAEYVGAIVASSTELECIFRSNDGARAEPYVAHVNRVGLDIGVTTQTGLAWAVNAPTYRLGHGALAGQYGGIGANATVGVGVGANLLVGGSANAISLQPLSVQGQTGLSAVAGIVSVDLRSPTAAERHGFHHHHRHHHYRYHHHHHHG
jgi:hypothetical protein